MRQRRPDGQSPDEDAEGASSPVAEPGRDQFQRRWIYPRKEETRREAEEDSDRWLLRHGKTYVGRRRTESADDDHPPRAEDVGERPDRRRQSTGDETELHGDRQPGRLRRAQVPCFPELRDHRRRGEPRRHAEDEGTRQDAERASCTPIDFELIDEELSLRGGRTGF